MVNANHDLRYSYEVVSSFSNKVTYLVYFYYWTYGYINHRKL